MDKPKPGTKVLPLNGAYKGQEVYVTNFKHTRDSDWIAIHPDPDFQGGGSVCYNWEVIGTPFDLMSDADKATISKMVLAAATKRGYCDETKNVLADLGLPTKVPTRKKVTVEIEYDIEDGYTFGASNLLYKDQNPEQVITIVRAKEVGLTSGW